MAQMPRLKVLEGTEINFSVDAELSQQLQTDTLIIACDTDRARTIYLPQYSTLTNVSLNIIVVDITGTASAFPITVSGYGGSGDLIDGATSIQIATNFGSKQITGVSDDKWISTPGSTTGGAGSGTAPGITIDGAGGVITLGPFGGVVRCNSSGIITGWQIFSTNSAGAALSGSIVVDTWKAAYAGFPPTVANTIWGGSKPTLSGASKNQATGLSIAYSEGDLLMFNVDSCTTCVLVNLYLQSTPT